MPVADIVSVPAPSLMSVPVPVTVPPMVEVLRPVVRVPPFRLIVPRLESVFSVSLPPKVSVAPVATVTPEVLESRLLPTVASVPASIEVAPPKLLAPESVRVPAVALTREPLAPEITPAKVPSLTVRVVVPRAMSPPLRMPTEAVAPFRFAVPEVSVPIVAMPPMVSEPPSKVVTPASPATVVVPPVTEVEVSEPAVTVPPEMSEFSRPKTLTVPSEIPPVEMVAPLAKLVVPAPLSEARVMMPMLWLKLTVPSLVTPTRERPMPEIAAVAELETMRVAAPL